MTERVVFELRLDGVLTIDAGTGSPRSIQQIDEMFISSALPLENAVVLILQKSKSWGTVENLVCLDAQADVVWRAPVLDSSPYPKEYSSVALSEEGFLTAHTWGGVKATLDPATGRVLSEEFVK